MSFGQIVIGPPGSGKSTYTLAMSDYLRAQGRRVALINLDPANDLLRYKPDIDITELIAMDEVMETFQLGPNGGLMYCIEYLEKNMKWLKSRIAALPPDCYFIMDLPGQVELYTHHQGMKNIVDKMQNTWKMRLTCVNLIDSHHCSDASSFLSVLLISLSTMTQLEMPHVNILSKMDLIESYGELQFGLEFYTDVLDLTYLLPRLKNNSQHPLAKKFARLQKAIAELIESYNLVSFLPLDIQNLDMLMNVVRVVDKANGFVYTSTSSISGKGAAGSTTTGQQQTADEAANAFNNRLLNTAHMNQHETLSLPDIQERYLPQTTQTAAQLPSSTPAAISSLMEKGKELPEVKESV